MALVVMGSLAFADTARANASFDYTGTPFFVGTEDGSTASVQNTAVYGASLDASVTFAPVVTPDFTGFVLGSDILAWSLTAGPTTLTSGMSGVAFDASFTFVNGAITKWSLEADYNNAGSLEELYTLYFGTGGANDASLIETGDEFTGNETDSAGNEVGTWVDVSSSSVPEPASAAIFGTALIACCLARRRRS